MTTNHPAPEGEDKFGDMAARIFELEHELADVREKLADTDQRLAVTQSLREQDARLLDGVAVLVRAATHEGAAKALLAARDFRPTKKRSWRAHLSKLAAQHAARRRALEPELRATIGPRHLKESNR